MTQTKHTPGPWFTDNTGFIWRRHPNELYENGGGVAGDKPLAICNRGWTGEGQVGFPMEANARLIAAAPELLEVLKNVANFDWRNNKTHLLEIVNEAIAKATGETP